MGKNVQKCAKKHLKINWEIRNIFYFYKKIQKIAGFLSSPFSISLCLPIECHLKQAACRAMILPLG
jgi:hypothetical protein